MSPQVALLRGINVGGNNIVRMAELRAALASAGLAGVQTYIQSGNIVAQSPLDAAGFGALIAQVISDEFGVTTWPAVLNAAQLSEIIETGNAAGDPAHAHGFVFREPPEVLPTPETFAAVLGPTERVVICPHGVVLFAPDGLGRSTFAQKADRAISVPVTARNFRTLNKLLVMAKEAAA